MSAELPINAKQARELLGLAGGAPAQEIRRAFLEAAKSAHPDVAGGGAERFRQVVEAYRLLQPRQSPGASMFLAPAIVEPAPSNELLTISPLSAMNGGAIVHNLANGKTLRIVLPPGLRNGDTVRAGAVELSVIVQSQDAMLVRGDDLWITVEVDPRLLSQGGRIAVETPLGRRIVWINRQAGARGLVRLVGQGLPARAGHSQGHLFLRLSPHAGQIDSAARALLRRFAAAWAA